MNDYGVTNQWYQAQEIPREYKPVGKYTAKTLGWMLLGLMVTFLVSMAGYVTGAVIYVFMIPYAVFVLAVAEVTVVLLLSARINKVSVGAARGLLSLYVVLNNIMLSAYFLMYNVLGMMIVFAATSAFFGVVAMVGRVTEADLSKLRSFLVDGSILLVAFWLFGMSISLVQFEMIACTVGIFISLLFTVHDTQKTKAYHAAYGSNPKIAKKASIFPTLQLYLDFINPSLYLLRVLGGRK